MKLRDYPWWPSGWAGGLNAGQVRQKGIFKRCLLFRSTLTLIANYDGRDCQASIAPEPGLDLKKLHDLLLPHRDKPMQEVDSLEFECD
jgi:hypothetical protein